MAVRIISALVGSAIAISVLFLHNTIVLPIMVALLIGTMLFELLKAAACIKLYPASISVIAYGVITPLIYNTSFEKYSFIIALVCVFTVLLTLIMKHREVNFEKIAFMIASMLLVTGSMTTTLKVEDMSSNHGAVFLLLGLCGAWIADSGAYFAGVFLGKHKLCPEISPKKTIEGLIGGIITTAIIFVAINFVYQKFITSNPIEVNYILMAFTGMVCAVLGTLGDLTASMIKRQCGIKDYGNIMPGHGGMMDRFDSVLFVMPTFYAMLSVMNIYQ